MTEEFADYSTLYRETLEAAQEEARGLDHQIEHLRDMLVQLERRKQAVDDICCALERWTEIADSGTTLDQDNSLSLPLEEEQTPILLSEEEVSLLAYPAETTQEA